MALETSVFVTDAWSTATMREELAAPYSYYLVACLAAEPTVGGAPDAATAASEVVAYAGLRVVAGSTDADIQTIAVAPAARRRGLGRALMVALLGQASRRGAHEVFLEVRADNPHAQRLYLSLGFERLGVRPHYYQPDDVDAVVMRLALGERGEPGDAPHEAGTSPDAAITRTSSKEVAS
jgi:ribosomal-protein-alanine acetyltransferase